jgi:hypothetical protein
VTVHRGQCQCGAVTFSAEEVKTETGACHCRMCQRWSGGILIAATAHGLSFEGEEHISVYRSSDWAERGFCRKCGSHLFWRMPTTGEYEMCVGVFDDQSDFVLGSEIFVDRKPDGYAMAGEHPRLTEAETLEKYKEFGE